jgi:ABC-type lipoprotein release transport system permease subunit
MRMFSAPKSLIIWLTAWRMLRSTKGRYLSGVTLISLAGVVIGVSSLLVIFGITSGFEDMFRDKLLGIYPHAVIIGGGADVTSYRAVELAAKQTSGVLDAAPATYDEMMISFRGRSEGAIVKGVAQESLLARSLQSKIEGAGVADLATELVVSKHGQIVSVEKSDGGVAWTLIGWPNEEIQRLEPCVEELPSDMVKLRLVLESPQEVECILEGLFEVSRAKIFATGESSYQEVSPGLVTGTCGDRHFTSELTPGTINTLILLDDGAQVLLEDSPPGRSTVPATVRLLNLSKTSLTLSSCQQVLPVQAGERGSIQVCESLLPGIILGIGLAKNLDVELGDHVSLVSPLQGMSRMFRGPKGTRPVVDTFTVAGVINLGYYEYDTKIVILNFKQALRFLHRGDRARWVEVITQDIFNLDSTLKDLEVSMARFSLDDLHKAARSSYSRRARAMEAIPAPDEGASGLQMASYIDRLITELRFGPVEVMNLGMEQDYRLISWTEMNRSMFVAMQRQRLVLSLFFLIIIIVAAFNIVGSQSMMISEKLREISMLKVIGFSPRDIRRVFTIHGLVIGGLGAFLGLGIGVGLGLFLDKIGFPLDPVVYYVDKLPVSLRYGDMIFVTVAAFLLVYIAVLIAASRAAAKTPLEGLTELE